MIHICKSEDRGHERGSITIFFLLFALVIIAVVSYSLYVGRSVDEKIKNDTAADIAALAMASHAAQGLNMIAINNLATAANLHVAASITFLGRYYAIARALLVGINDILPVTQLYLPGEADKSVFATGFKHTAMLNGHFTKTAAGLTLMNRKIAQTWLYGAPLKGLEQARMNAPGSVTLPLQVNRLAAGNLSALYAFRYESLAQTSAAKAMCQTIKASEVLDFATRNAMSFWIGGSIQSMTGPSGIINALQDVESAVLHLVAPIAGFIEEQKQAKRDCKFYNPLPCIKAAIMGPLASILSTIPFPRFAGCALPEEDSGSYDTQLDNFAKGASGNSLQSIGFIVPNVDAQSVQIFEDSLQYAVALGRPLFLKEEIPQKTVEGISVSQCPPQWTQKINGREICSLVLDGINFGATSHSTTVVTGDAASGGVGRAVGDNNGTPGQLRSVWKRVQWSIAQAKAEYEPDTTASDFLQRDPSGAALDANDIPPNDQTTVANMRRMQLFWPAWRARNAEPTMLQSILSLLGQ